MELSLRIPNAVQILESNAVFEVRKNIGLEPVENNKIKFQGVCRATFSGQDSQHTLIKEQLHIPFTAIQLPTTKVNFLDSQAFSTNLQYSGYRCDSRRSSQAPNISERSSSHARNIQREIWSNCV